MKKLLTVACALFLLFCMSCTSLDRETLGKFTIISTRNIDLAKAGTYTRTGDMVEGKNYGQKGTFIKTKNLEANYQLENAVEDALKQIPGAVALKNASIRYDNIKKGSNKYWGYSVEGTILLDPQYVHLYADTDYLVIVGEKKEFIVKHVDKTEFDQYISSN